MNSQVENSVSVENRTAERFVSTSTVFPGFSNYMDSPVGTVILMSVPEGALTGTAGVHSVASECRSKWKLTPVLASRAELTSEKEKTLNESCRGRAHATTTTPAPAADATMMMTTVIHTKYRGPSQLDGRGPRSASGDRSVCHRRRRRRRRRCRKITPSELTLVAMLAVLRELHHLVWV